MISGKDVVQLAENFDRASVAITRELERTERFKDAAAAVAFSVSVLALSAFGVFCTTQEKAVVRTVVDIARAVCTPQDTLDACVDKILADHQVKAARLARTRE